MSEKEEVIKLIKELPDSVSIEEIMRELYIHLKFQRGVQEMNEQKKNKESKKQTGGWLH